MVRACAAAAHEVNRVWCLAGGDNSQVPWLNAPEWQQTSAINGVLGVLAGNSPRESHEGWLAEKQATGWKYGPVKNAETKEHPCFVAYEDLPPNQQVKDSFFVETVTAIAKELGLCFRIK